MGLSARTAASPSVASHPCSQDRHTKAQEDNILAPCGKREVQPYCQKDGRAFGGIWENRPCTSRQTLRSGPDVSNMSSWQEERAQRNQQSLARLTKALL